MSKNNNKTLKTYNNIKYANENVEGYYGNNTWHLELKKNSEIIGILLQNLNYFNNINVNLDQVITTLCSLMNYCKNRYNFFTLPDRFVTIRNELSKEKTESILFILSNTDILDIKYVDDKLNVKLNRDIVAKDEYLNYKKEAFYFSDCRVYDRCCKDGTIFFFPPTKKTILRNIRFTLLGLTVASYQLQKQNNILQNIPNIERPDITYMEIPIDEICYITKCDKRLIYKYLKELCKNTNYVSKHDKVYIDSKGMKHYYNNAYKECDLTKVDTDNLEEGHPKVTNNSIILYNDNFKLSNTGKYITKNLEKYKAMYKRIKLFLSIDKVSYKFKDKFIKEDTKEYNYKSYIDEDIQVSEAFFNEEFKCGRNISLSEIRGLKNSTRKNPIKFKVKNIDKLPFQKLCKHLKEILDYLEECEDNVLNYYTKLSTQLINRIQFYIQQYKQENSLSTKYNTLIRYNLESIANI